MWRSPPWVELIQLAPVVSLAFPIIVRGEVDLPSMGGAFAGATVLAVLVTAGLRWRGHTLNPILLGTAVWLALGAVGFGAPVPQLASWLAETQAFGLFAAALGVGVVATVASPAGYIGAAHPDPAWVRKWSLVLLAVTSLAVVQAWLFRHDVRLGGGLPFILLNVTRRIVLVRG
ncbi:MAG: hypothetical protein ACI8PZ_003839 [Myxococcota bacterium]|jgi:hypothetical protein